jgi:Uma2 family endonuclease
MALPFPHHLLTLEEYDALPEDSSLHYELLEGVLAVSPRPGSFHQEVAFYLMMELYRQLPREWTLVHDVEVALRSEFPPTLRAPDVLVVPAAIAKTKPKRYNASEVLLAVEIISPGSRSMDTSIKPGEYAKAGISHYWVIDLEEPLSLAAYHLAGDLGYQQAPAVSKVFSVEQPFPVTIDLTSLPDGPERDVDQ